MPKITNSYIKVLIKGIIVSILPSLIFSATAGVDVYEHIDHCIAEGKEGNTGPECDIPYEICPDNKRKCFNNSQCVTNESLEPFLNEYGYTCDCSFAAGISEFAGFECEHSATTFCQGDYEGSLFCTNGGTCGLFTVNHITYSGCECGIDYAGAHCQYLKEALQGGLMNEHQYVDAGDNFWGYNHETEKSSNSKKGVVVGVSVSVAVLVAAAGVYVVRKKYKIGRRDRNIENHRDHPQMQPSESDII